MTVTRWDPFQDLLSVQQEMNQLFDRIFGRTEPAARPAGQAWAPPLDIAEHEDAYVVTVELPGVKPEELDVSLENGMLTIQGERRFEGESSGRTWHRVERRYGAFRRSVSLPAQVQADKIEAAFDSGLLRITVPKAEEARPRKIQVRKAVEGTARGAA